MEIEGGLSVADQIPFWVLQHVLLHGLLQIAVKGLVDVEIAGATLVGGHHQH